MVSSSPTKVAHLLNMPTQEKGIESFDIPKKSHFQLRGPTNGFAESDGRPAAQGLQKGIANGTRRSEEQSSDSTTADSDEPAFSSSLSNESTSPQSKKYPTTKSNGSVGTENKQTAAAPAEFKESNTEIPGKTSGTANQGTALSSTLADSYYDAPGDRATLNAQSAQNRIPGDLVHSGKSSLESQTLSQNNTTARTTPPHSSPSDTGVSPNKPSGLEEQSKVPSDLTNHQSDGAVSKNNEQDAQNEQNEQNEQNKLKARQRPHRPSTTASKSAAAVAAARLDNEVLVGTRVSEGHGNFITAYNMLTGIRVAVSRCTAKVNRPLTASDFSATDEISFDMSGGGHSPSSKYMFHFKDYSPWVFRHLRELFKLDPADYLMSLTSKYIVSELGSPGKSGSFFYYSRDYRFIIKTIRHSEHKLLRRILRRYYEHVKTNPNTLISQFYGLHRVSLPFGRKIHFVVMNNVFPALYEIHERYDLKGSVLGREYTKGDHKPIVVYKDLDWLRNHRRIVLGPEKRENIIKQLEKDVAFLKSVNVMDYSLLIGIHDMSRGNSALKSLFNLDQFGPVDKTNGKGKKGNTNSPNLVKSKVGSDISTNVDANMSETQREFSELQTQLQKATPEKLKEFDFADEYRSAFYFYRDHGGFQSTDVNDESLDVIYYVGVIDFLTGYTLRKSIETFCKSLIHDRKELSAVPAGEYGDRFMKFLRGSIGPAIKASKPTNKRNTDQVNKSNNPHKSASFAEAEAGVIPPRKRESGKDGVHNGSNSETKSVHENAEQPNSQTQNGDSNFSLAPVTAVTVENQTFETAVKAHSPPMLEQCRRPSVVGYGQDLPKIA